MALARPSDMGARRIRELLAMAQRPEWPGGVPRHAAGSRRHARFLCMPKPSRSAGNLPKPGPALGGKRVGEIRSCGACIPMPAAGPIDWQAFTNKNYDPIGRTRELLRGPLRAVTQSIDVGRAHQLPWSQYKLGRRPRD